MDRIKVGDVFGDFSLKCQRDVSIDTTQLSGKKILLSFHPLAWTDVCARQMQSLETHFDDFGSQNTIPLGVSVDSAPCKKAWAKSLGIEKVDMLADFWPHGDLATKLGIFIDKFGFSERANIILDGERKAAFVKVYPMRELPDINEILEFLKK